MEQFDIAIVGAGPGGATFARLLAKSGKRIVLIDNKRSEGSFRKPCGGLLSGDAQKALARYSLTLPKSLLVDPQIFAVKTIDLASGLVQHYQRFYLNLDRHAFDLWLISLVAQNVTRIEDRVRAVSRQKEGFLLTLQNGGSIGCRYLVGADGAASIVRKSLFAHKKFRHYVAIQQTFSENNPNPFYSCVFDPETSDCCSWSISKNNQFIFGGAFAPKNCRKNFELQKLKLASFGYRFGSPLKTEACLVLRPRSYFDFCMGKNDVFLIGEAAGLISPSSLEGISYALESARLLAEVFEKNAAPRVAQYRRAVLPLRLKLAFKVLKCPFMYQPFLRRLIMKSGLSSIRQLPG